MERVKHFMHCNIAGFSYYEGALVFNELTIGTELTLNIEPDNKFDPHAVAVYYGHTKLGYLPADKNEVIHLLLEMGHDIFETRIQKIDPTANPENQVHVIIYVKRKEQVEKKGAYD
ncbi:MAG: HIRAN domain-containing protein [Bacteroidales bacterium]